MKQYRLQLKINLRTLKLANLKVKDCNFAFSEEFRQIYKKEKCKIDTMSQFCIFKKQFNKKLEKSLINL